MTTSTAGAASGARFWRTVFLLLRSARQRAVGRRKRQRELLRQRSQRRGLDWGPFTYFITLLVGALINGMAAFLVYLAVSSGERASMEYAGKIPVSGPFLKWIEYEGKAAATDPRMDANFQSEAWRIETEEGGSKPEIEQRLRRSVRDHGLRDFVNDDGFQNGMTALTRGSAASAMLGSIVLLWWCVMIVFQGEGLELDLQRRRHPMWEWLASHPVPNGAIFMAEMLSPLAANPIYCAAPLFAGVLYGLTYGWLGGLLAAFVIGVPISLAAACLGKALEIGAVLRFAPRTRGAVIGLMSWIGYASLMLFLVGGVSAIHSVGAVARVLQPLAILPWPWLGFFLGVWGHAFSFPLGMLTCWLIAGATATGAVAFSAWGAQQGLAGNFGAASSAPKGLVLRFGKDPLYRKELLWFARDRSAIVQTILVPITVAGFQLFNMRGLIGQAQSAWNFLCGAAIIFGTYFLWVLGPKSLASEGPALWIALTWPRGLESLLKAKAWLWSMISSGIVLLVLLYAAWLFPRDAWKVLLVGAGWMIFGRSMAEKTVTMVRAPSSSGELERPSRGRQWAASLGMLTFAIGILSQQWHLAIMGIVYSYITAAAMWENFRARLPFLYDPWSEKIPPPPTLMHAMIAISVLVETAAVFIGSTAVFGKANLAMFQTIIYAVCASIVSICTWQFLKRRGVLSRDVWCWARRPDENAAKEIGWCGDQSYGRSFWLAMATGVAGGSILGLVAHGYLALVALIPSAAETMRHAHAAARDIPGLGLSYFIIGVFMAPFAEEYLFRGLLFRALDREWGGWRAVLGGAAFFAIYHQPLAWVPVGLLGAANALLYKKTGRLAPAVALHMVYNAVVLGW